MQIVAPNMRLFARRTFATSTSRATSWSPGPSPPRLPKEEQEIFEQLQKDSTGAFSTPRQRPQINQSPHSQTEINDASHQEGQVSAQAADPTTASSDQSTEEQLNARVQTGDGEELHPNVRRGAAPEFEGDVNPLTKESGGPKNNPLRWGHEGDWSYNGRVTDF